MAHVLRIFSPESTGQGAAGAILPAGAKRFLAARLMELAGLALTLVMGALAVALFSYAPSDP
ncbi:MAG: hypothetical protein VW338_10355, partial [Rhodospirillaceae bacterium]